MTMDAEAVRDQLAEALLQFWESEANESLRAVPEAIDSATAYTDTLLPTVLGIARQTAADEIEQVADEQTWVTQHDNEVVSARDLYERVALLRGELEPVTYDFPPEDVDARAAALGGDRG